MKTMGCFLAAAAVLLGSCGDKSETNKPEWRIGGTYQVIDYFCGDVDETAASAELMARITPPNTFELAFSDDGLSMEVRIVGESCTWTAQLDDTYTSATAFHYAGKGTYACLPSAVDCHDFMILTNALDICGDANSEADYVSHTPVPTIGETMEMTWVNDTWCSEHGYAGRARWRLTRVE